MAAIKRALLPPILKTTRLLAQILALPYCALTACGDNASETETVSPLYPNETPQLRALIVATADENDVPVALVQKVKKNLLKQRFW